MVEKPCFCVKNRIFNWLCLYLTQFYNDFKVSDTPKLNPTNQVNTLLKNYDNLAI